MASRKVSMDATGRFPKRLKGLSVEQVVQDLLALFPCHQDFVVENIIRPFDIPDEKYVKVLELMKENFERGLNKATSSATTCHMSISYVREVPDGTEEGDFLALDIGGSINFRILKVSIKAGKCETESKTCVFPDRILKGTGTQFFDFIADNMHRFLKSQDLLNTSYTLPLGFTFAFPIQQESLDNAVLLSWTKGFQCTETVGKNVAHMLQEAVQKRGEMNLRCEAIINDTVGTLMSGALEEPSCAIGLVIDRGVNACYFEKLENVGTWNGDLEEPREVIINTEWHGFGNDGCLEFIRVEYDKEADDNSVHKGTAIYEKMISSRYLGELVRLVLVKLKAHGILFTDNNEDSELSERGRFYTKYISEVLSDEDVKFTYTRKVLHDIGLECVTEDECRTVHHICYLVTLRAASLCSIGITCLLNKMNRPDVGIAVHGGMYKYHEMFREVLTSRIPTFLNPGIKFKFVPAHDGKGKGAAIVAAVANRRTKNKRHTIEGT